MRYYELTLTSIDTGQVLKQWSSYPGGTFDPGALNIMFDVPVSVGSLPIGSQTVVIEGISLSDLSNAQQYAATVTNGALSGGAILTLKGGMGTGLPLVSPAQQGILVQGAVFQSWGTWVGTDMSISFVVIPTTYSYGRPGNIVFDWQQGQKISTALYSTLATAFPGVNVTMQVSGDLVAARTDRGFYQTFNQLAQHIQQLTAGSLSSSYPGVQMVSDQGGIKVFDGTTSTTATALKIYDFIGQPTWIQYDTVQVKVVLRGDLQVSGSITFPQGFQSQPGAVQTLPDAYPNAAKYQSAIQGTFIIQQIRHLGNFRDPDGGAWSSILNCVANG